ncbi:DUF6301 family protein [Dactylosporangium sp. NPDC049140]|uniref:DUF6301 family protein n=1 Tax=Dactylosporangium sp. NPDC049140 TaxID=3155647 RepID=UPI0033EA0CC3
MTYPLARTTEEVLRYLELHPCVNCGSPDFGLDSVVFSDGSELVRRYAGACATCGAPREFLFRVPAQPLSPAPDGYTRFGGLEPSELLDAGEWIELSDDYAQGYPADPALIPPADLPRVRRRLAYALAALDEVVKFAPPGADTVPEAALWTDRGRALWQRDPARFRLPAIDAYRDAYRDLIELLRRAAANSGPVGPAVSGEAPAGAASSAGAAGHGPVSLALPRPPDGPVTDRTTGLRRLSEAQLHWAARQLIAAEPLLHLADPHRAAAHLGWREASQQDYPGGLAVDPQLGLSGELGSELGLDDDEQGVQSITLALCDVARPPSAATAEFCGDVFALAVRTLTDKLGAPTAVEPGGSPQVRWQLADVTLVLRLSPVTVELTGYRTADFDDLLRNVAQEQ